MFKEISNEMIKGMKYLEKLDAQDRLDGTERLKRLRQIPPETGKLITLLAANAPDGEMIEVGTSAGYSTMWLSLAAKEKQTKIHTFELLPEKIKLAKETFYQAQIEQWVHLIEGDALQNLDLINTISFCFLDCEKELYLPCWSIISSKMITGGVLIADNVISHQAALQPFINKVLNDSLFDSVIVPIGKGELICRKK
ncbi:MAG: O-methyltransferase [Spirochaetes bacterium]|nr:O-methyltransferase [Spirochaetota bacterium]